MFLNPKFKKNKNKMQEIDKKITMYHSISPQTKPQILPNNLQSLKEIKNYQYLVDHLVKIIQAKIMINPLKINVLKLKNDPLVVTTALKMVLTKKKVLKKKEELYFQNNLKLLMNKSILITVTCNFILQKVILMNKKQNKNIQMVN